MNSSGPKDAGTLVSIVIPVYFNEGNIPVTWKALRATLEQLPEPLDWEVVFVEDGSGDASYEKLLEVYESERTRVRILKFPRNFGQTSAILAGMEDARGDCCIVMSADLQDPPELILEMVGRWRTSGRKIVLATRIQREDGFVARVGSRLFYRLMRRFAAPNMPDGGFDFFLLDRQVLNIVNALQEKNTFLQGQILWTGFQPEVIEFKRRKREIGRSRWTLTKKLSYFLDGFVTYTVAPIRLITVVGIVVSALSFSYAALIIILKLFWDIPIHGWAPTMVSILSLGGVQLLMLGIIGEYLWRNYYETRKLPNFVIETKHGDDDGDEPASPGS